MGRKKAGSNENRSDGRMIGGAVFDSQGFDVEIVGEGLSTVEGDC
jgi:hypothetical protein